MTHFLTNHTAKRNASMIAFAVLALSTAASASKFPGNLATFTNAAGNTQDLFTFTNSGSTVVATGDLSGANTYYYNGAQLVGFRALYLVNTNGANTPGVSTISGGGVISDAQSGTTFTYPVTSIGGTYSGYDNGAAGSGYPSGASWFSVANPSLAGKTQSPALTHGEFTFTGPVQNFDIGLDYILAGGQTGRGYFALPQSVSTPPHSLPTPEPSTVASLSALSALLGIAVLRGKKRRTQ